MCIYVNQLVTHILPGCFSFNDYKCASMTSTLHRLMFSAQMGKMCV